MRKYLLLSAIALALLAAGCSKTHKADELGQTPGTKETTTTPGGDGTTEGGADRGSVLTGALAGLKTIYFDYDKYNLRDDAKATLEADAKILIDNPKSRVVIEGHCDERGTTEYNLALGEKRASATRDFLIRLGVDPAQLSIISYGEERPAAFGHDEDSWSQNRRSQFGPK